MNRTAIEWTDLTTNPLKFKRKADGKIVWACVKVSPGCKHCYAETLTIRYNRGKLFNAHNMEELEPFLDEGELWKMLNAKKVGGLLVSGSRCFIGDMTDLFAEWVSDELLDRLFAVMALRNDVTWQVLTKRPERMRDYLLSRSKSAKYWKNAACSLGWSLEFDGLSLVRFPLPNVWLGVSVEDQQRSNRIDVLRNVPASVRFLSLEPLLEDIGPLDFAGISWVIVGGESGSGARPCNLEWIRSIVRQCRDADAPCFVKQLGSKVVDGTKNVAAGLAGMRTIDNVIRFTVRKGGDPAEWPSDLRAREYPA